MTELEGLQPADVSQGAAWAAAMDVGLLGLSSVLEGRGKHAEAVFHRRRLDLVRAMPTRA